MGDERVERRLAAILAADVVGYSRLMGSDEEGTLATLKGLRKSLIDPKIADHRGRIVKNTGDGALVEFASAVDAVRCALEIQHAMAERNIDILEDRRIEFRIGINIGDVIIDEGDIYGDGVNIAARVETLASPGAICLSDSAYQQIKGKVALGVSDMGEQQLKNIAQPVRVYSVRLDNVTTRPALALPDKPSIAVLAFENMSGDAEQEYFADGIAEDIITALSKSRWLFVIARNSSFTYKGRAVDIKQIGRELGVRYVLEGSVRKSGNRVRITGQLVEAATGTHLWAERYDRDLTDIFAVQDEITESVASAIEPAMAQAERLRVSRKPPESLVAWEAYHRGLWHFLKQELSENDQAKVFFQRVIDLDPGFAGGFYGLALTHVWDCWVYVSRPAEDCVSVALPLARRALKLDDADPMAHLVISFALMLKGDLDEAVPFAQQAVNLNPNNAWAIGFLGGFSNLVNYLGDGQAGLRKAMRLSPHDPMLWTWTQWSAIGQYFAHDYSAALEASDRVIRLRPDHPLGYLWKAAALAQLDQVESAKKALQRAIEISPPSVEAYKHIPARFRQRSADYAYFLKGLRKAGLPDEPSLALPDKPSIAVLPFQNMSGDPEQEYFADGVVEDITTALSRFKGLFVIARNSSFTYKGKAVDVRQIGRELGVRYVLEGSVRKGGNRVRITVQLVDAVTGNHLWADKYEGAIDDVFDLQDRIAGSTVGAIEPNVRRAEIERAARKRPENLDAYDLYLRALPRRGSHSLADSAKALEYIEAALKIDPDYAAAHALAAYCYHVQYTRGGGDPERLASAVRHARATLMIGTDDATALATAAFVVAFEERDFDTGLRALDNALAINPNSALALGRAAGINMFVGNYDKAIEQATQSIRLSPLDPLRYIPETSLAFAYFLTERFAQAVEAALQAIQFAPAFHIPHVLLAASYVRLGRLEEARLEVQRARELAPGFTISMFTRVGLSHPTQREQFEPALREAGFT
jgi:adenylate cyclase